MTNYYTNIEIVNNNYIGTVYKASDNTLVHRTQSFPTQAQAIREVNEYIKGNEKESQPATTINTVQMQPTGPIIRGRCCGR
jgi:hypothetical protein